MGRASTVQNAFNAGELSSLLLGRQDVDKYAAGLFVCLNAIPLTQGGWTRRPGTAYLHQCKHHNKLARLIPFTYSITQKYVLEFGEQYIRFFTEHGILTAAGQSITGISKAAVAVLTYSGADTYSNGDRVFVTGVLGMTQVNNREFVVTNVNTGANTFELYNSDGTAVVSTNYGTRTSGGTVSEIIQVATAFVEADLVDVNVTQSADTLYVLHPDHPPQQLVRVTATSWTLADIVFTDGPYDTLNTTTTTLTPGAATGSGISLTASAVTGINDDRGFLATDVGRLIRIQEGSTWGYVEITAFTNTTLVTVTILSTLTNTNAKTTWRLGVWSDTTGFPRAGTFHEDRLFLAGAAVYPQRLDGSKTGIYSNFSPSALGGTVADDNAVSFVLNSNDVNAVQWIHSDEKGMLAGTSRSEWQIRPSSQVEALTPTNIKGKPTTHYGSASAAPIVAGKAVLFIQRASRKVRELVYVFEVDGFKAPDMTLLSEHITRPSLDEIAYQEQPQAIVWGVRGDGVLLGMTYEREQAVVAWHRHELGGQSDAAGLFIPVIESVAVIPSPDTTRDELYVVVQRYVNGATRRYIEYLSKIWEADDEQEDAFHVDCGWTTINTPATDTVTGLWHLEGETLGVYVDGTRHVEVTVTNGTVTLDRTGTIITLGYFYPSDGQTMPIDGGSQDGSSQGKTKRIARVGFWLLDTLGLKYGEDADNLTEILIRQWGDDFGTLTPLFTGITRERFESDYDKLGQVYWRADGPFPANVLAVMPQFSVADDS
jgi:hypothetical protein